MIVNTIFFSILPQYITFFNIHCGMGDTSVDFNTRDVSLSIPHFSVLTGAVKLEDEEE